MDANTSRNTYDMEQIAAHAEKMANAGAERFHPMTSMNPPPPPPLPMPIRTIPSNAAGGGGGGGGGTTEVASAITPHGTFEVYNPVDDSFAAWQEEGNNVSQQQPQQRSSGSDIGGNDDEDTSFFTVKKLPFENKVDDSYNNKNFDPDTTRDTKDAFVAETDNMDYSSSNDHTNEFFASSSNNTPLDDDALARAVAEQDLPPGVSAIEQQEIMMRLLTQQIRRGVASGGGGGDGSNNDEPLSPALEQRMRDFQFAQRKRRETYGNERPWGILGLYDHLGE